LLHIRDLPPGPDEGVSVPVGLGSGPVDGVVDPVDGVVDPGVVGPGRHWLMHPQ